MSTSSPSQSLSSNSHPSSSKNFIEGQYNSEPVLSRSASALSKQNQNIFNLHSQTQICKTPDRLPHKQRSPLMRLMGRNYNGFLSPARAIQFQSTANQSKEQSHNDLKVKAVKKEADQTSDQVLISPGDRSQQAFLKEQSERHVEQVVEEVKRERGSSAAQESSGLSPADLRKLNTPNKSQEQFFQSFLLQQFEAPEQEEGQFEQRKVKRHGFYRPFHPFQIASWVIFALDCFLFALFGAPSTFLLMPDPLAICVVAISILLMIAVLSLSAIGSRIDPTDPVVYEQRKCKAQGTFFPEQNYEFYCNVCQSHVSDTAKHCGQCNRCVANFDHHCHWLNNCVGRPNYRVFISLIWSVCVFTITQVAYALALLTYLFINPSDSESYYQDVFNRSGASLRVGALVGCFISILLNVLISLFIFNLIFLHIFLKCKKLTTFEYIVQKRERQEEQQGQKEGKERKKRKVIERKKNLAQSDESESDSGDKVYKLRNQSVGPLQLTHGRSESDIDLKLVRRQTQQVRRCGCWHRKTVRKTNQVEPLEPIQEEIVDKVEEEVVKHSQKAEQEEEEGIVNHSRSPLELQRSPPVPSQASQEERKEFTSRKPSVVNFVQSCSVGEPDNIFSPISKSAIQKLMGEGEASMADLKVESMRSPSKRSDRVFGGRKGSDSHFGLAKKRNSRILMKQIEEGLNPRSKSIGRKSGIISVDHRKTLLEKPSVESKQECQINRFSSYLGKEDDGVSARSGTSQKRSRILEVIQIPKKRMSHNYTSSSRGDQTPKAENQNDTPPANIAQEPYEDEFDLIEQSVTQEVPEVIEHNL